MSDDFTFRVHLVRAPSTELNIDRPLWEFKDEATGRMITLSSPDLKETIKKSRDLILKSSGWDSEAEALAAAEKYTDIFRVCFAKLRLGIDYGRTRPRSMFTKYGLAWLSHQSGHERILNDMYGVIVYETNPPPRFAAMRAGAIIGKPEEQLYKATELALKYNIKFNTNERLSIDLFNASFFQESQYVRFMLLVMAIEALLKREERSSFAIDHIEMLIKMTNENARLSQNERISLVGSLVGLKNESINQLGRILAKERLGTKMYNDKTPDTFFSYCYYLRSRLVHGGAEDSIVDEIRSTVGTLEFFVSDLLSGPLKDII